jgi:hypothetical protein
MASTAGRMVRAATIAISTAVAAPKPMLRRNMGAKTSRLRRLATTVRPLKRTVCPAVRIVSSRAARTAPSCLASSSLNRLTTKRL